MELGEYRVCVGEHATPTRNGAVSKGKPQELDEMPEAELKMWPGLYAAKGLSDRNTARVVAQRNDGIATPSPAHIDVELRPSDPAIGIQTSWSGGASASRQWAPGHLGRGVPKSNRDYASRPSAPCPRGTFCWVDRSRVNRNGECQPGGSSVPEEARGRGSYLARSARDARDVRASARWSERRLDPSAVVRGVRVARRV